LIVAAERNGRAFEGRAIDFAPDFRAFGLKSQSARLNGNLFAHFAELKRGIDASDGVGCDRDAFARIGAEAAGLDGNCLATGHQSGELINSGIGGGGGANCARLLAGNGDLSARDGGFGFVRDVPEKASVENLRGGRGYSAAECEHETKQHEPSLVVRVPGPDANSLQQPSRLRSERIEEL